MTRSTLPLRLLLPAAVAGLVLTGCTAAADTADTDDPQGIDVGEPPPTAPTDPADSTDSPVDDVGDGGHPVLGDGDHLGFVRSMDLDRGVILVDLVTWVNDDHEPNGFRVENPDATLWSGRLAADVEATVIDCSQACEAVAVDLAVLADGGARPFNGRDALFDVVVRGGAVTSIEERYTP